MQENYILKPIYGKYPKPVLENWIKDFKSPQSNIDKVVNTAEILKRIPDFPDFMDKANYALQLIAEGNLI